jgi:hypothetical protein
MSTHGYTEEDIKDGIRHGYKNEIFEEIKEETGLDIKTIDEYLNKLEEQIEYADDYNDEDDYNEMYKEK